MSFILDLVQTHAIINLRKMFQDKHEKFDVNELEAEDFYLYTLNFYDHRAPEKTIALINDYKADENPNLKNNFFLYRYYGNNLELANLHSKNYAVSKNLILQELIDFYIDLSNKSNFIISDYHVKKVKELSTKMQKLDEEFNNLQHATFIKNNPLYNENDF
jgi:hypothetical protein